jgi:prepilin-type N-terminal cleavage/methylation domain-containing protein
MTIDISFLNKKKNLPAFTLIEILIALGIIGIVAALTIPSLINKIQDKQNIAKWKKEYSLINNAFIQTLNEGYTCTYSTSGTCTGGLGDEFIENMMSKFKVFNHCTGNSGDKACNYYNSSWWNEHSTTKWSGVANIYSRYKALGVKSSQANNTYTEYGINAYNFYNHAYLLIDGAVVYFGASWEGPWIVVDVNNFQNGPNEIGRDVFIIKAYSNNKTNQHWLKPAGAQDTPNWNNPNSGSSGCSKDIGQQTSNQIYNAAGAGCSAKYLYE